MSNHDMKKMTTDFVTTNSKGFGPSQGCNIPISRNRGRRQGREINVSSNSSLEVKLRKLCQANWEYRFLLLS
jgi:hypothetical protein